MGAGFDQIITVDGASGVGKTQLLRGLAATYGCAAVELGPVVRTASWLAARHRATVGDAVAEMARLAAEGRLTVDRPAAGALAASEVHVCGRPMRQQVFSGELNAALAAVSLDEDAMSWIFSFIREAVRGRRAVLSARDAARSVCPTAVLRVRLDADAETRRARKLRQLASQGVRPAWMDDVSLLAAPDPGQWVLDTTRMTPDEVLAAVGRAAEKRMGWTRLQVAGCPARAPLLQNAPLILA